MTNYPLELPLFFQSNPSQLQLWCKISLGRQLRKKTQQNNKEQAAFLSIISSIFYYGFKWSIKYTKIFQSIAVKKSIQHSAIQLKAKKQKH